MYRQKKEAGDELASRPPQQEVVVDNMEALLAVLPPHVQSPLRQQEDLEELLEVVLDLGRYPQARFTKREMVLSQSEVTEEDLQYTVGRIGPFGDDNRAGIERTLHRISGIRNRAGRIIGLTCRVGRAVFGTIKIIEDMVRSGKNILLMGRPGVGKTTMLREVARVLADDARKRVVVVDTSNEIAGDGDIPHRGIGGARRMQVKTPNLQHEVMIEAVENHMPEVIIIDEMGTQLEAAAARTIAERGVQLVATAHGNTMDNLIMNPTLSDLVGGIQTVTLGDEEARNRGTQKTVLERKSPPTFYITVEIQQRDRVALHSDVAGAVDTLLRGYYVAPEVRWVGEDGSICQARGEAISLTPTASFRGAAFPDSHVTFGERPRPSSAPQPRDVPPSTQQHLASVPAGAGFDSGQKTRRIFPYGVNRDSLYRAILQFAAPAHITLEAENADIIVTTKAHYRKRPEFLCNAEERAKSIFVLRRNTQVQIERFIRGLDGLHKTIGGDPDPVLVGLREAEEAVGRVMAGGPSVELPPETAYIRRLQHQLAERYNLASASMGREPRRRVIILRR